MGGLLNIKNKKMTIKEMIENGTVLDVRTPAEFAGGHVANSVNIPLQELPARLDEVKALKAPLVLCCASGGRSGMAEQMLAGQGFDCTNGGGWMEVNFHATQN
jgi:rhodanese-related sulfurtransferase